MTPTLAPDLSIERYRVLLLDDQRDWLEASAQLLKQECDTIDVDITESPEEANRFVARHRYDACLADVLLRDPAGSPALMQGDAWLLSQHVLGTGVLRAAVTAFPARIRDRKAMHQQGIGIAEKATDEEDQLFREIVARAREKEAVILQLGAGEVVAAHGRQLFIEWLQTRSQPDDKDILIGGELLSAADLAQEVQNDTAMGKHLLGLFLSVLKRRL